MTLISQWKEAWKFSSVQTALILGIANAFFALIPALSDVVTLPVYAAVSAVGNVAIILLRLVAQPKLNQS
jgi:hypothetical protein